MAVKSIDDQAIFEVARKIASPAAREAYLQQMCADDPDRQERIAALLRAHEESPSFLEPPARDFDATLERPPNEEAGYQIGPYKLVQQIGEGGMGTVWMAQQTEPVKRLVALKLIKAGMDSGQVIARFEAERQALALMEHPNIAKVFDGGTTGSGPQTGSPYFVMELVKGVPITRFCDENHLTPRQRLELFVPVCQAIQHAHQKGIIHRDIKPSNVLVALYDDKPVPKIIDFGVAKATGQQLTERTLNTGFGSVVGTLEYMSPEQAGFNQLDIDTRSDIYSLGVLLYELLAGSPPFTRKDLADAGLLEMLRVIREQEPSKPSTKLSSSDALPSLSANRGTEPARLTKLVRGELDWIVMKALEKDRTRRYESANGFAMDLLRYLADEPVQACPPSAAYRLRKFARRNKAALAAAAVVALALMLGTVVSTWQAIRATTAEGLARTRLQAEEKARAEAEVARDGQAKQRAIAEEQSKLARKNAAKAESEQQRAEANFAKARQAVDEYLSQVTESELLSVPGLQPLREDLLRAALKFYAEFTQERGDDPTLQRELASAHHRLARIQRELGNTAAQGAANREAIRLFEQLRDQGEVSVDLQAGLASAYFFAGRYDDTVKLCLAALKVEPKHAELRSLLADSYNELATAAGKKNDVATALAHHQRAFELREALVRDIPDNPRYLAHLGGTVNNLGNLLERQRKLDEALAMYERSGDYTGQAYQRAPHSILWGSWLCIQLRNVARMQVALDRQEDALRSYERLVAVSRKRAFENPAIGALRGDLYRAYLALGNHQKQLGDTAGASRNYRLAREVLEQIPRETPDQLFDLATVYAVLASPPADSEEPGESDAADRQRNANLAMATLKKAVDGGYQNASALRTNKDLDPLRDRDDFQAILTTVLNIAEADRLARTNEPDAAKQLTNRKQAADLLKGLAEARPGEVRHRTTLAATLHSIGVLQTGLKQFDEAEKSLDEALKLRLELLKKPADRAQASLDVLSTRAALGQLYWESDRPQEAHRLWQDLLVQCQQTGAEHATLRGGIAGIEWAIAQKYGEMGLWELALAPVEQGLKTGQLVDATWDCRGVHVLAALGRVEEHGKFCQLIAGKWGKKDPAHVVFAAAMNPEPGVELKHLLELAEGVVKSDADSMAKFQAATAYYRASEYERALELMLPFRERISTGGAAYQYWLAMVYHKLGQKDESARYFEQAEARYLRFADRCLQSSEKTAAKDGHGGYWWAWAEDQAMRRVAWNELRGEGSLQDSWQHLIQARGYRLIGEHKKCAAELAAAAKESPQDTKAWISRARMHQQWDEPPQAAASWNKAVESAGNDPFPWIHRGRWYAERGEHEKANADFARAASLTPHELNKFLQAGWWVMGPYPASVGEFCPPELDPDPSKPVYSISPQMGLSEKPLAWRTVPTGIGGQFDLASAAERKQAASAYALTYVSSPADETRLLRLSRTHDLRVWVNGDLVADVKQADFPLQPFNENLYRLPIGLRQGRNVILIKTPAPSFTAQIADTPADRVILLAEQRRFRAASELAREIRNSGEKLSFTGRLAHALALEPEPDLYLEFCQSLLTGKSMGGTACALLPNPLFDEHKDDLIKSAESAFADSKLGWVAFNAALIHYRAGNMKEAAAFLALAPGNEKSGTVALRALIAHRSEDAAAARQLLDRSLRDGETELAALRSSHRSPPGSGISPWWYDWASQLTLLREAEQTIRGQSTESDALISRSEELLADKWTHDQETLAFDHALIFQSLSHYSERKYPHYFLLRGRRLAELGRFDEAEADFNKAVELKPDDIEALLARARFHARYGDLAKARDEFEAVANLTYAKNDWPIVRVVEREIGLHDAVLDMWQKTQPQAANLWRIRAERQSRLGNWEEAVGLLAQSDPYWSHEVYSAALCCLLGDAAGYERACKRYVELRPEGRDDDYQQMLVFGLRPATHQTAELARLTAAHAKDDLRGRWHRLRLAIALYRVERYDEALVALKTSLYPATEWQADCAAWPLLAMAHWRLDQHDEARKWLARSAWWMDLSSRSVDVPHAAGPHNTLNFEWLAAHVFYFEAKELIDGPQSAAEARKLLAKQSLENRQRSQALAAERKQETLANVEAAWQRAVEQAGDDPLPWIQRGHWYAELGKQEKADADFAQAKKLDPEHPFFRLQPSQKDRSVIATWDFTQGAEGWRAKGNCQLSAAGGVLRMESTGVGPHFRTELTGPAGRQELTICARFKGAMNNCRLYWATKPAGYGEDKKIVFSMTDSDQEWREYRVSFEPDAEVVGLQFSPPYEDGPRIEFAWMMLAGFSAEGDWQRSVELAGENPLPWIERGRWYAQRGEQEKADADFAKAASLTPNELNKFLEAGWWVAGPYPPSLREFCPPELDPDTSQPVYVVHPQTGLSDQPIGWRTVTEVTGNVDARPLMANAANSSFYALAYVYSPDERTALLRITGAKGIRLWVNGKLAFESEQPLGWGMLSERVPIALLPGRNKLLVKTAVSQPLALRLGDSPLDRATTHAERRLWDEAATIFGNEPQAFQESHAGSEFTKIALLVGRDKLYVDQCLRIFERHRRSGEMWPKYHAAHAVSFAPNPVLEEHYEEVLRLALGVVNERKDNDSRGATGLAILTAAWASLQTGRDSAAERYLSELPDLGYIQQMAHASRAILAEKKGNHVEAVKWLEKSHAYVVQHCSAKRPQYWPHTVTLLIQLREAERIVTGSTTRSDALRADSQVKDVAAWKAADPQVLAFDHRILALGMTSQRASEADALVARGRRMAELGRLAEAQADFDKAVTLQPNDVDVWLARAAFHSLRDDVASAQRDFAAALQRANAAPEPARYTLAPRVENELCRHDAVIAHWQSQSNSPQPLLARVRAQRQIQLKNWKAAVELLSHGDKWLHNQLRAPLYCLLDDAESYQRICEQQMPLLPTAWEPRMREQHRLLMLSLRPQTGERAVELSQVLKSRLDENLTGRMQRTAMGAGLYRTARYEEALEALNSALEPQAFWQKNAQVWPLLAMTHWQLGHEEEARKWLAKSAWWIDFSRRAADVPNAISGPAIDYPQWLHAHLFHAEARALIESKKE
jgi:serine/threonine protein kinase/tetratricopeptide (TPR) repeat protein